MKFFFVSVLLFVLPYVASFRQFLSRLHHSLPKLAVTKEKDRSFSESPFRREGKDNFLTALQQNAPVETIAFTIEDNTGKSNSLSAAIVATSTIMTGAVLSFFLIKWIVNVILPIGLLVSVGLIGAYVVITGYSSTKSLPPISPRPQPFTDADSS